MRRGRSPSRSTAAEALPAVLDTAAAEKLSLTAALERLLALEVDATQARRLTGRLRGGGRRRGMPSTSSTSHATRAPCSYVVSIPDAGGGTAAMTSHVAWNEIRADHVARAGGEAAVEAGKREPLALIGRAVLPGHGAAAPAAASRGCTTGCERRRAMAPQSATRKPEARGLGRYPWCGERRAE